jgi:hypothetical protein
VNLWIQTLLADDLWPIVHKFAEVPLELAAEKEKEWIKFAHIQGWPLLNATDGGEGCYEYPWKRIAIKLSPKTSIALGKLAEELGIDDVREVAADLIDESLDRKFKRSNDNGKEGER